MRTRAAVLQDLGAPLCLRALEVPELQSGQVLVRIAFSGVCRSQLMEARGLRGDDKWLPHLLGHEATGTVSDRGLGVTKVSCGDRVVLTWIKGDGADCGGSQYRDGDGVVNAGPIATFGEYMVVSENRCVPLPQGVPMDVGALLGCAVLTGVGVVFNTVRPQPASSIVIWGAGGIGLSAVIAARHAGCYPVLAVDTRAEKLALARECGAHHTIDASREDPLEAVRRLAGSGGVDYAVEAAGRAETIEQAFAVVRKGGGLCVFASHPASGERIRLDPHELISGKQIRGTWGGESQPDRDIPMLAQLYRDGKLPLALLSSRRYALEDVNQALADLEQARVARPLLEIDPCQAMSTGS